MTTPRRALVLIDVQNEYFSDGPLAIRFPPREESLARILEAVDAAERENLPVVVVRHEYPQGAPVFAAGSEASHLQGDVAARARDSWHEQTKAVASVFADEGTVAWLREQEIDTVTLAGYMTNNCVLGSAAAAEPLGFAVEVLQDATGAIDLSNEAGSAPARQVHETLMTLLHSNWAAVATTDALVEALKNGTTLQRSDLGSSAVEGRTRAGA